MYTLSDYLFSVLIAGAILLMVLSLEFQGGEASIDAEQYRAAKLRLLDLIEVIERDFHNIGSQRPDQADGTHTHLTGTGALVFPDTNVVGGKTVYGFQFNAQTDSADVAKLIRYEWWQDGTVTLDRGTVSVFTVERTVNGVAAGRSEKVLTFFNLVLLDAWNNRVTNPENTRQIEVHLISVSPLGPGEYIEESHWRKFVAPLNMARLDT